MIASKLDALIAFLKQKHCSEKTIARAIELSINPYQNYNIDTVTDMVYYFFERDDDSSARINVTRVLMEWIDERNNRREYDKDKNN